MQLHSCNYTAMSTPSDHPAADLEASEALAKTPCTCAMLRRASRRLTQAYDQVLKPTGLKLTQYSVLANVAGAEGRSITALALLLAMDRTTLTRNLRPLEGAGLIRIASGPDRRSRAVEITSAGRQMLEKARPLWRAAERSFRRRMGRKKAESLRCLLDAAAVSARPEA